MDWKNGLNFKQARYEVISETAFIPHIRSDGHGLIELEQISPKPNKRYVVKFTPAGYNLKNSILAYKSSQYSAIKQDFVAFCKLLRQFGLVEGDWYGERALGGCR